MQTSKQIRVTEGMKRSRHEMRFEASRNPSEEEKLTAVKWMKKKNGGISRETKEKWEGLSK